MLVSLGDLSDYGIKSLKPLIILFVSAFVSRNRSVCATKISHNVD